MTHPAVNSATLTRRGALVALAGLCGVAGYGWWAKRRDERARLEEFETEEAFDRRLEKLISVELGEVSLRAWLAEFARQAGVDVEIRESNELDASEDRDAHVAMNGEMLVKFDAEKMAAHELLTSLAQFYGTRWDQRADGTIVFNETREDLRRRLLLVQLPNDLSPRGAEKIGRTLCNLIPMEDSTLGNGNTGSASIAFYVRPRVDRENVPGASLIVQGAQVHWQVTTLLTKLQAAYRQAADFPARGLPADDPALQPQWLNIDPDRSELLLAAFERPISISVREMPWPQFVEDLSKLVQFPLVLHPAWDAEAKGSNRTVTCEAREVPLRIVLQHIAGSEKFTAFSIAGGRLLEIADQDHYDYDQQCNAAFPVPDFGPFPEQVYSEDPLHALLAGAIPQGGWFYGYGADGYAGDGRVLVISQTLEVVLQVQTVLTALRRVRCGEARRAVVRHPVPFLPSDLSAKLAAIQELTYDEQLPKEILANIADRAELKVYGGEDWTAADRVPITCHFPARPLAENMQRLFSGCLYQPFISGSEIRLIYFTERNEAANAPFEACEAFDLRPWFSQRPLDSDRLSDVIRELTVGDWYDTNQRRFQVYDGILVARAYPNVMRQIAALLPLLGEYLVSGYPKRWRGERLSGERLNLPLRLWDPDESQQTVAKDIEQRLQQKISCQFRETRQADALLTLAKRYELPMLVYGAPPASIQRDDRLNYAARDRPLGEVLQDLIGDPRVAKWSVDQGSLQVFEAKFQLQEAGLDHLDVKGHLFCVDDLIRPRGPWESESLLKYLEKPFDDFANYNLDHMHLLYGNLLWLHSPNIHPNEISNLLRRLRSNKSNAPTQNLQ